MEETMKAPMEAHKYFAFLTLFCMAMTIITGHEALRK
jgi:cytochrome c oxidase assembly protein Cox11